MSNNNINNNNNNNNAQLQAQMQRMASQHSPSPGIQAPQQTSPSQDTLRMPGESSPQMMQMGSNPGQSATSSPHPSAYAAGSQQQRQQPGRVGTLPSSLAQRVTQLNQQYEAEMQMAMQLGHQTAAGQEHVLRAQESARQMQMIQQQAQQAQAQQQQQQQQRPRQQGGVPVGQNQTQQQALLRQQQQAAILRQQQQQYANMTVEQQLAFRRQQIETFKKHMQTVQAQKNRCEALLRESRLSEDERAKLRAKAASLQSQFETYRNLAMKFMEHFRNPTSAANTAPPAAARQGGPPGAGGFPQQQQQQQQQQARQSPLNNAGTAGIINNNTTGNQAHPAPGQSLSAATLMSQLAAVQSNYPQQQQNQQQQQQQHQIPQQVNQSSQMRPSSSMNGLTSSQAAIQQQYHERAQQVRQQQLLQQQQQQQQQQQTQSRMGTPQPGQLSNQTATMRTGKQPLPGTPILNQRQVGYTGSPTPGPQVQGQAQGQARAPGQVQGRPVPQQQQQQQQQPPIQVQAQQSSQQQRLAGPSNLPKAVAATAASTPTQVAASRIPVANSLQIPHVLSLKTPVAAQMKLNRPTLSGGNATSASALNSPAIMKPPPFELSSDRVLSKRKLSELVRSIAGEDENISIDGDVEELLLDMADEFVTNVTQFACRLSKLRKCDTLDIKDVQLHLERNWNIRVPGYNSDEVRSTRRWVPTGSYQQKLNSISANKAITSNSKGL